MKQYPMIILAGKPPERDELMDYADVDYKALIDINGKPMFKYVLEQIQKSELVSYLLIVGKKDELEHLMDSMDPDKISYLDIEGKTGEKFHQAALHLLDLSKTRDDLFHSNSKQIIYMTSDIPSITSDMMRNHMKKCQDSSVDLYYSVVEREFMDKTFPGSGRTYMGIEGGKYAGVDIAVINIETISTKYDKIRLVTEQRKSFLKGVFLASPFTFIKLIIGKVKMKDVENLMSKIFGLKAKLIITEDAEMAFDVDKPFQLDMMREFIKKNR